MTTATAAILAHQGGWDEALMVAGPLLVIAGLLWVAKRRVDRAASDSGGTEPQSSEPQGNPTTGPP